MSQMFSLLVCVKLDSVTNNTLLPKTSELPQLISREHVHPDHPTP